MKTLVVCTVGALDFVATRLLVQFDVFDHLTKTGMVHLVGEIGKNMPFALKPRLGDS